MKTVEVLFLTFSNFEKHLCNHSHMYKFDFIPQLFQISFVSTLGMPEYNHTYLKKTEYVALIDIYPYKKN